MANHEYAHCDNCIYFEDKDSKGIGKCTNDKVESETANKKSWCGQHFERNSLNANCMAIEYGLRRDHGLAEMQRPDNTKPLDEFLKAFKWDGVCRLREKWPEDTLSELLINHAETGRDREACYPSIKEQEEISNLEYLIETRI
jgi:hypothetical protein